VFESRHAARELGRFDAAVLAFRPRLEHLKQEVGAEAVLLQDNETTLATKTSPRA
jgi:hypothetical protein